METNTSSSAFESLRWAVRMNAGAGRTDGQLLDSYIEHRDDDSFAALVRRHGPMVIGVPIRPARRKTEKKSPGVGRRWRYDPFFWYDAA